MYLTEISPINLRGTLGSAHQLFITIAILVSQFIGLPSVLGSVENWPLVFGKFFKFIIMYSNIRKEN